MLKGGLKFRLAFLLAALLLIGVGISYLVTLLFSQRELVSSELEHIQQAIHGWSDEVLSLTHTFDESQLKEFCAGAQQRCIYAGSYSSNQLSSLASSSLQSDVVQLIAKIEKTNQLEFSLSGSVLQALFVGSRYLLIADRINSPKVKDDFFLLIWDLSPIYVAIKRDQRIVMVYLLFNVLILTVIGFFRIVDLVIKPIDRLISLADQYQISNSVFYAEGKEHSEFGQLNTALGNMIKRIESDHVTLQANFTSLEQTNRELMKSQDEVVRAEKLASVGRLSAGFAHEIGNPITIIQGYIELLQKSDLSNSKKLQYGDKAIEELQRVNKLISNLLDYARDTTREVEPIRIDQSLIENIWDIVGYDQDCANIEFRSKFESGLVIYGNREPLRQVLLNCVLNAIDGIREKGDDPEQGVIRVTAVKGESEGASKVLITIEDDGVGVSEEQSKRVFDPFYTTKPAGKGTGLGLYVSHLIVDAMGGKIWIESNENRGARVSIQFKAVED